jgi:hypothetical protein
MYRVRAYFSLVISSWTASQIMLSQMTNPFAKILNSTKYNESYELKFLFGPTTDDRNQKESTNHSCSWRLWALQGYLSLLRPRRYYNDLATSRTWLIYRSRVNIRHCILKETNIRKFTESKRGRGKLSLDHKSHGKNWEYWKCFY